MTHLSLSLLGTFQARLDETPVTTFATDKVRALLAYLAVESGQPHHRETLAGLLWPERPERSARRNLSQTLFSLRQSLGGPEVEPPFLLINPQTLQFNRSSDHNLDVTEFSALLAACEQHPHHQLAACDGCLDRLQQAVRLYRGIFLAGLSLGDSPAFEEWLLLERERYHRWLVESLHRLTECYAQRGEYAAGLHHARRWLELEPWQEQGHRQLMRLLALDGQRSAALTQYESCCRILAEELNAEPEVETTALYERIRTGEEKQAETISPGPRHNLPAQQTPFVGRTEELARIARRLADPACRLLTLVGPGGSGKTRLALEAGAAQLDNFEHGVFLVSLAPLDSVEAIVPTVAEALGFSFYTPAGGSAAVEPQQQLLDYLRQKTMLLIMDSYEHLLSPVISSAAGGDEEGTNLVTEILRIAPGVKILATSRVRLNLGGEHRFPVGGMEYPPLTTQSTLASGAWEESVLCRAQDAAQYDAVKLFLQGARRAQPGFTLTDENLIGIVQICHLVEGMPLSIRLAAAWVEILAPAEIAEEIERGLDFLETEVRDVPARQRSIRAAFDYSWQLLTDREKAVYRALSVFRGGFTRQAAAEVARASVQELKALADKSFLNYVSAGRYEIHELLRQYATEKLDQTPTVGEAARDRHSAYYCTLLQQREADLKGARQQAAVAEIEAEQKNIRVAWNQAVAQGQIERLSQAIESLGMFYEWRGRYQEGEAAFRLAAEGLAGSEFGGECRLLARVLAWQGLFNQVLGRSEHVDQLLQQSLFLLSSSESTDQEPVLRSSKDVRAEQAFVLRVMGWGASSREEARRLYEQSLDLYRALGDCWGTALALASLGENAWFLGDYDQAKQLYAESLAIRRIMGDQRGIAASLKSLGGIIKNEGQLEEAERLLRESLALCRELGDWPAVAHNLFLLGVTLEFAGKFAESRPPLGESLQICNHLGDRGGVVRAYEQLRFGEIMLGQYQQARTLIETAQPIYEEVGRSDWVGWSLVDLGLIAIAEKAYAVAKQWLQESVAIFRETEHPFAIADSLGHLVYAERGLGHTLQARQYLTEALRIATEVGAAYPLWETLPAAALLLADQGELERAVELYALASCYPLVANSRWFEDVAGQYIAVVAATLPPEVVAAAQERGQARDLWEMARELLVEFED